MMKKRTITLILHFFVLSSFSQENGKDVLTEEQKLYGLSQIWSVAKYNFVYYDQLKINWDSLYQATIPVVKNTSNIYDYYNQLRWFAAHLNDGHTGVWFPKSFYQSLAVAPAVKTDIIQGRVFITEVLNDTLSLQGITKGMEILKINGISLKEYAEDHIAPFESASTPQGKEMLTYQIQFTFRSHRSTININLKRF